MDQKPTYQELEKRVQELEQADRTLQESELKFRSYISNAPYGIFVADEKGGYIEVNDMAEIITGYSRSELLKMNLMDLIPDEDHKKAEEHFNRVVQTGKASGDLSFIKKNGSLNYWSVMAVKFGANRFLGFVNDITNRKRFEQDYQTLFREMLDGLAVHEIICDADGEPVDYRYLAVNPAFERLTGLEAESIVGHTVLEAMPGTESHWIKTFGHVALSGEPAFFENYSKELDKHFKVTAFQPIPNQFACIFSDITERKLAEEERMRLNSALAAKNTELEQIVYVASHDLRTPLVNIDGYSKELNYAIEDLYRVLDDSRIAENLPAITPILKEDIPEAIHFIRTSASKMDDLLTGVLHLSRSGRAELKIEPLNMNVLISSVIDSIEFQIKDSGVQLEIEELPQCQSDALQVNQVFSNLISNALKYLDPHRPGIIRLTGWIDNGENVYCVEDNGIGIEADRLGKIFEIFHRLDPSNSEGEGLGLTIVKWVMNRLEGRAWVESEIGSGSRFFVTLPTGKHPKYKKENL
ncbi:PAS domain S-box protein [Desulfobacterales bacterium HSG17]|nr:PAS domain S-box protein [Desulfobacterales bacterium HSG17]